VLFCLQLYLLSPFMRRYVRRASLAAHLGLTGSMAAAAAALLAPLSAPLACLFAFAIACVSLLCPLCLVRIHKFKAKINGPWDEAVPDVPTHLVQGGGYGGGGGCGGGGGESKGPATAGRLASKAGGRSVRAAGQPL
jgi:phosphatidylinositol glycan class C protein